MPLPIHALLRDEIVRGPLLLTELEGRKTRNGADFLDLKFKDATGQVAAKFWQTSADALAHISVPSPVWVHARVDEFQGRPQLVIEQIEAYTPTDEEFRALIPTSAWPAHLLWEEIRIHLRHEIQDEALWQLVEAVLEHPEVVEGVPTSPAATRNHHAYRAGLVEHMLSMLRLAAGVTRHYEQYYPVPIHRGLIAAGILLHDIGKIWELSGDLDAQYTDEGRLLGHIFMAARWIEEVAKPLGTPRGIIVELQHLILSHHGELAYGSPKRPKTLEAMVLHHIDKLDADMNQWMSQLTEPGWTMYQRNYERPFFRPDQLREDWSPMHTNSPAARGPGHAVDTDAPTPAAMQAQGNTDSSDAPPAKTRDRAPKEAPEPSPTLALFDGLDE